MSTLSDQDMEDIKRFLTNGENAKILRQYNSWNFSINDVLVRYYIDYSNNKVIDRVSQISPIPKKFKVLYIDELNIPWVKQISVRGGLGKKLYCLANYANNYFWQVDPAQIEALLLDAQYDPRIEYKMMKLKL